MQSLLFSQIRTKASLDRLNKIHSDQIHQEVNSATAVYTKIHKHIKPLLAGENQQEVAAFFELVRDVSENPEQQNAPRSGYTDGGHGLVMFLT